MSVDPAGQDLKRYLKEDPGGPVVMLNLLKYRPGGERSYHSYSAALEEYLPSIGAEVLYVGNCSTTLVAPATWDWDAVLIVRYPSRQAFSAIGRRPRLPVGNSPAHRSVDRGGAPGDGALAGQTLSDPRESDH